MIEFAGVSDPDPALSQEHVSGSPTNGTLEAWKNIAHYLNVTVRTAQRWAKDERNPLPVHRRRNTVFARKSELDDWWAFRKNATEISVIQLSAETYTEAPPKTSGDAGKRWRMWNGIWALPGLVFTVALLFLLFRPHPAPRSFTLGRLMASFSSERGNVRRFRLPGPATEMALSPTGDKVFACSHYNRDLYILQGNSGEIETIHLNTDCGPLATTVDGRLFVGSAVDGIVAVDLKGGAVNSKRIETGGPVYGMAPTPDGGKIFLAMGGRGLKRLSTSSGTVDSISDLPCPESAVVDPAGKLVYVPYQCKGPSGAPGQDSIEIIDVNTERRVGTISGLPMVGSPVSFSPDGSRVVLNGGDACSSPEYKFNGCRRPPSAVHHLMSTSDRRVLATWELPLPSGQMRYAGAARLVTLARPTKVLDSSSGVVLEEMDLGDVRSVITDVTGRRVWALVDDSLVLLEPENPECSPPQAGLAMYFSGDGTLQDPISLNVLSQHGEAGFAPGFSGQAFRLDGGSFRTPPRTGHLTVQEQDWTLSMDIKISGGNRKGKARPETVLDWTREGPRAGIRLSRTDDDRLLLESWPDGQALESQVRLSPNSWTRVDVTRTDEKLILFLNGEPVSFGTPARKIAEHLEMPLVLGQRADWSNAKGDGAFHGLLDEVLFYEKALPAAEIRKRFRTSRSSICSANPAADNSRLGR